MVNTDLPSTSTASVVQLLIGNPSTSTVQAPQTSTSQERFVPLRPRRSRSTSISNSNGAIFKGTSRPFRVSHTSMVSGSGKRGSLLSRQAGRLQHRAADEHRSQMLLVVGAAIQVIVRRKLRRSLDRCLRQHVTQMLGCNAVEPRFEPVQTDRAVGNGAGPNPIAERAGPHDAAGG